MFLVGSAPIPQTHSGTSIPVPASTPIPVPVPTSISVGVSTPSPGAASTPATQISAAALDVELSGSARANKMRQARRRLRNEWQAICAERRDKGLKPKSIKVIKGNLNVVLEIEFNVSLPF
jgi:hypothetical protein